MNPIEERQRYLDQTSEMANALLHDPNRINQHLLVEVLYWLMVIAEKLDSMESVDIT